MVALRRIAPFDDSLGINSWSGEYRACDHDFRAGNGSVHIVEADPDMPPVAPYFLRSKPEITWQGLQYDDEFTIAIIDVGFGTLNYLLSGFPHNPKVRVLDGGCLNRKRH